VFNEKPADAEIIEADAAAAVVLPAAANIHTNMGDILIKLQGELCPRTVENFATHAKNGYYDHILFHRIIKNFMIQTGAQRP
jgi:peptidylprolyl isomerase domain and WD repeat-containing protein 1